MFPPQGASLSKIICQETLPDGRYIMQDSWFTSKNSERHSCAYVLRTDLKKCPEGIEFVSLERLARPEIFFELKDMSVGGILYNVYQEDHCDLDDTGVCNNCATNLRLQLYSWGECVDGFIAPQIIPLLKTKVYEKIGEGDCCVMIPIKRRVVLRGDAHKSKHYSAAIVAYDMCFIDDADLPEWKP